MKISKDRNEVKPTGLNGWVEKINSGPLRLLLTAAFILLSLTAGFLYAWKYHPRAPEATVAAATETPAAVAPTLLSTVQKEIPPLPTLAIFLSAQMDGNTRSATLLINGGNEQTITVNENQSIDQTFSKWQLILAEENPNLLLAGKEFQLVHAETDEPVSVWLYAKQMREAGVKVPDFIPALVSIDGAPQSVYYLITADRAAPGIYFNLPESFFTIKPYNIPDQQTLLEEVSQSVQQYQSGTSEKDLNTLLIYLTALMRNPDEKGNGFAVEAFSEYFAIHDLWSASYADLTAVPLYFYNIESQKIEPALAEVNAVQLTGMNDEISFPFSNHPLYELSELQINYISSLAQRSTVESFEAMQQTEYAAFHAYEKQIKEKTGSDYSGIWDQLSFRYQMMRLQVNPPYPVRGFVYAEPDRDCVNLGILNLMVAPVDVESVSFLGVEIPLQLDWLQNPTGAAILEASEDILRLKPFQNPDILMNFCVPGNLLEEVLVEQDPEKTIAELVLDESAWMINARLSGLDHRYSVAMIPDVPPVSAHKRDMPPVQTVQELTETFPFIKSNIDGSEIRFLSGHWQVEEDIVIPSGLIVTFEPGCQLYFASDVVLLSYSAFQAMGTEMEPVLFSASGETWPGMIVIDAQDESRLEHVIVEKTGGIERGGWILTGGITFYRSPLTVSNSTLQDSVVEDAINIIRTTFTFDHLTIQRTPSDAFDSDFADGEITNCHFEDIGGDAIDISGAYIDVSDTTMINVVDKGLSAGEDSHMSAHNLSMVNMGIGAAAKDLSSLVISNTTIENARVAGLAAYIKKSVFGPSSIEATNVQIVDTATETLVQTGSSVIWNGKKQDTKELNVKTLYALGILGN